MLINQMVYYVYFNDFSLRRGFLDNHNVDTYWFGNDDLSDDFIAIINFKRYYYFYLDLIIYELSIMLYLCDQSSNVLKIVFQKIKTNVFGVIVFVIIYLSGGTHHSVFFLQDRAIVCIYKSIACRIYCPIACITRWSDIWHWPLDWPPFLCHAVMISSQVKSIYYNILA